MEQEEENIINIFETVRDAVSAREAAERYGIRVNRSGMALCPFHDDHNPSLKLDKHFYCFGCNESGDAINLAAKLFNLSLLDAAKKLADDFGLHYDEPQPKKSKPTPAPKEEPPLTEDDWVKDGRLLEGPFCEYYLQQHPMRCVDGRFFTKDGMIADETPMKNEIIGLIKPYIRSNLAKRVKDILAAMRILCHVPSLPKQFDRVHVANGTVFLDGTFTEEKEYCLNRLPIRYNPDTETPLFWHIFLYDLLEEDDIKTLQEYLGYCLIPSNKGQKMLMLIGNGGEGKSRINLIMQKILGDNMNTGSIQKVETNKFASANLQFKLLMVDDDMQLSALPHTNIIKEIITTEGKMDLERKNIQSFQGDMYCRFLAFGNGALTALYDKSFGFFRRQIVLTAKAKDPNRKDDPYLIDHLYDEAEGIFLWMLEGLKRLVENNFHFTLSKRAVENLTASISDSNNVLDFLHSEGYIEFCAEDFASSKQLYDIYVNWCDDNAMKPLSMHSFCTEFAKEAGAFRLEKSNKINIGAGRFVRGYIGVRPA